MKQLTGLVVGLGVLVAGCGQSPPAPRAAGGTIQVVASFYPLEWTVQRLAGDQADLTGLTTAGTEPHDLVLTPRARQALAGADLVLYLGSGFQPDVERAVGQLADEVDAVDLLAGLDLIGAPGDLGKQPLDGGRDPHVWLDPIRMSAMAAHAAQALVTADPGLTDLVTTRLAALQSDLAALHDELSASLGDCRRRTIVTSHAAFGYLADRYELDQVAIAGLSPDAEPDPATLRSVADEAARTGVTTVFFEEALPADLARTVAAEIGAGTDLLGALEFDPRTAVGPGEDYLSVMRRNSAALSRGLDCR